MKRLIAALVPVLVLGWAVVVSAQQPDAELQKVLEQYEAGWNKGDAKAVAALYTSDAIRIGADAQPVVGRDAVEKSFVKNFAGPWKGTTLVLRATRTQNLSADIRLQEGSYEISGLAAGPSRGHFLNTLVRQGGQWRIAGLAAVPEPAMK